MKNAELIERLRKLVQLDIDAVHAYEKAAGRISDPIMRERIESFREDHRNHITELGREVESLSGKAPMRSPDLRGYLIEGFTALRSITGTEGALKAMKIIEELIAKKYGEAISWEVPPEIKRIIDRHNRDEKMHLDYITNQLKAVRVSAS